MNFDFFNQEKYYPLEIPEFPLGSPLVTSKHYRQNPKRKGSTKSTSSKIQKLFHEKNFITWQFFYLKLLEKALTPLVLKVTTCFSFGFAKAPAGVSVDSYQFIKNRQIKNVGAASQAPSGFKSCIKFRFLPAFKKLRLNLSKNSDFCYPVNCFITQNNLPTSVEFVDNKFAITNTHKKQIVTDGHPYPERFDKVDNKSKEVDRNSMSVLHGFDFVDKKSCPPEVENKGFDKVHKEEKYVDKALYVDRVAREAGLSFASPKGSTKSYPEGVEKSRNKGVKQNRNERGTKSGKYNKFHTLPVFSTFIYKEWSHRYSFLEYFIWSARENDLPLPFYSHKGNGHTARTTSINWIKNRFILKKRSNHSDLDFNFCMKTDQDRDSIFLSINEAQKQLQANVTHALQFRNIVKNPLGYLQIPYLLGSCENQLLAVLRAPQHKSTVSQEAASFDSFVDFFSTESTAREAADGVRQSSTVRNNIAQQINDILSPNFSEAITVGTGMNRSSLLFKKETLQFLQLRNKKAVLFCGVMPNILIERCPLIIHTEQNLSYAQKLLSVYRRRKNLFIWEFLSYPEGSFTSDKVDKERKSVTNKVLAHSTHLSQKQQKGPINIGFDLGYSKRISNEVTINNTTNLAASQALPVSTPHAFGSNNMFQEKAKVFEKNPKGSTKATSSTLATDVGQPSDLRFDNSRHIPLWGNHDDIGCINNQGDQLSLSPWGGIEDTQQFPRLAELLFFTGGAALRHLLGRFNLVLLSKFLRYELKSLELKVNLLLALKILTYSQGLLLGKLAKRRSKQIRRLKLLELFQSQKSDPKWMVLSVIPVLPPDLRPILRVNDDFVVASDLNRLYQTVLRRNNTIHERLEDPLPCPESGLFRQRSLQKAVDGLLENGKGGGTPLCASKRRPLVSLSHVLKGKKGLFRQHLLGKRVDYSGRSVIVVGPKLNLHECGLPKEMALELFQPFLIHRLKVKGLALSNTSARRMIQQEDPVIWHIIKQLIYEHPVLLNRAPTLHRLGIQAFQPRLVSGRAILLHPLVCNGFNADFDGDQMAVHVPLSFQARAEAWKIMWSKNNLLSPATGQPILVPSQDMVLGCYYLSVFVPRVLQNQRSWPSGPYVDKVETEGLAKVTHNSGEDQDLKMGSFAIYPKTEGVHAETTTAESSSGLKISPGVVIGSEDYFNSIVTDNIHHWYQSYVKLIEPSSLTKSVSESKRSYESLSTKSCLTPSGYTEVETEGVKQRLLKNYTNKSILSKVVDITADTDKKINPVTFATKWHQSMSLVEVNRFNETLNSSLLVTPLGFFKKIQHLNLLNDAILFNNLATLYIMQARKNLFQSAMFSASKTNLSVSRSGLVLPLWVRQSRQESRKKVGLGSSGFNSITKNNRLTKTRAHLKFKRRMLDPTKKTDFNKIYIIAVKANFIGVLKLLLCCTKFKKFNFDTLSANSPLPRRLGHPNSTPNPFVSTLSTVSGSQKYVSGCGRNFRLSSLSTSCGLCRTLRFDFVNQKDNGVSVFHKPKSVDSMQVKNGMVKEAIIYPKGFDQVAKLQEVELNAKFSFFYKVNTKRCEFIGKPLKDQNYVNNQFSYLGTHWPCGAAERIFNFFNCANNNISGNRQSRNEMMEKCKKVSSESFISKFSPLQLYKFYSFSTLSDNVGINLSLKMRKSKEQSTLTMSLPGTKCRSEGLSYVDKVASEAAEGVSKSKQKGFRQSRQDLTSLSNKNKLVKETNQQTKSFHQLKRGHYFSSLQDSLVAYAQGRLQTHTPFWVRINSLIINGKNEQNEVPKPIDTFVLDDKSLISLITAQSVFKPVISNIYQVPKNDTKSRATKSYYKGLVGESRKKQKEVDKEVRSTPLSLWDTDTAFASKEEEKRDPDFKGLYVLSTGGRNQRGIKVASDYSFGAREAAKGITTESKKKSKNLFFGHINTNLTKTRNSRAESVQSGQDNPRLTFMASGNKNLLAYRRLVKLPQATEVLSSSSDFALFQLRYGFSKELCKVLFRKNQYKTIIETNDVLEAPLELRVSADGKLVRVLTNFQAHYNCNATVLDQCKEKCIKYMRTTAGRVVINEALFFLK